ncbi:MAG: hypothetical protein HXY44_11265 [Syntrophaceae bacterium]|nr:hypothetical protein [Syntrophaceae bacterium]
MAFLSDFKMYGRFIWGLRGFLKHTLTLEEAKEIIMKRMEERESNFLRMVKKGIFGYPKSPYLFLMKLARCEMGDIENMVKAKGLEGTLHALREAGVYVTFEEFKGREPIVRDGKLFPVEDHDFDNPYLSAYYYAKTGGTTGAGTRVMVDLEHIAENAPYLMVAYDGYKVLDAPIALWRGILPDTSGVWHILLGCRLGRIPQKWFTPITNQDIKPALKNRIATYYIITLGRWFGLPIPSPEPVSLDQAAIIARWASEMSKIHGACLIRVGVSTALRISIAAQEQGLDLTRVTLIGGGEPPTPAKLKGIVRSGVRWIPHYTITEAGIVGLGCSHPMDGNDLHFFKDGLALIQHPRHVPGTEIKVDAFHYTTLLPTTPKLFLNVESDDYGVIENRQCGCPLERYGFTEHLRHVRSFRKLTGEGVTLIGSEIIHILEEKLPSRFGGCLLDYQLMEEEDDQGFTKLSIIISPKINIRDEREVIEVFLNALKRSSTSADLARALWNQAETLRVKRMEPIWTARGKLNPLYLAKRSEH